MFRKLVSNISFSPALVGQLGFYARRLKKEEATRKIGLIFTVLALIVQSFAVFQAPQAAMASSGNDFVPGGVSSMTQYLSYYDNNSYNLKDIFNALGITRAELASLSSDSITTIHSTGNYYSWGHYSYFSSAQGERGYNLPTAAGGSVSVYARPLGLWGDYYPRVMVGNSAKIGWFAIMLDCGNLVTTTYPAIQKCSSGYSGVYPDCTPPPCPSGQTGTYPNCTTPKCPSGQTGTYPNCSVPICPTNPSIKIDNNDCKPCPDGYTGVYPNCKEPTCQYSNTINKSDKDCQPCPGDNTKWIKDKSCVADLIPSKTATNITQNNVDATTVVAKASDRIEYRISYTNKGTNSAQTGFTESLNDVSDYAKVTNPGGGTYDESTHTLTWPAVTIKPGETQTRIFSVQLSDKIPALNRGVSDKNNYDCKMLNTFGNSVTINVDCPAVKQVEQVAAALPHTGMSENMLAGGAVLAVAAYFYARSRQLKKEVRLIRRDINTGTI